MANYINYTETSQNVSKPFYKDLDFKFKRNSVNDVYVKKDAEAIKQSVINIVTTNFGERPFNPNFGCNLRRYLFEPLDEITASVFIDVITTGLTNHEPRIRVSDIGIREEEITNSIIINLEFIILTPTTSLEVVEIVVERLR